MRVPPLRERPEDVLPLARAFARQAAAVQGHPFRGIDLQAARLLAGYAWPGNVRELRHAIARSVALADGPVLHPNLLPPEITGGGNAAVGGMLLGLEGSWREARQGFDRIYFARLLERCGGEPDGGGAPGRPRAEQPLPQAAGVAPALTDRTVAAKKTPPLRAGPHRSVAAPLRDTQPGRRECAASDHRLGWRTGAGRIAASPAPTAAPGARLDPASRKCNGTLKLGQGEKTARHGPFEQLCRAGGTVVGQVRPASRTWITMDDTRLEPWNSGARDVDRPAVRARDLPPGPRGRQLQRRAAGAGDERVVLRLPDRVGRPAHPVGPRARVGLGLRSASGASASAEAGITPTGRRVTVRKASS